MTAQPPATPTPIRRRAERRLRTSRTARLLTGTLTGVLLLTAACGRHETAESDPVAGVLRARVTEAVRSDHPLEIEIYGTVESDRTAALSARVMAMVTSVSVVAGDRVGGGQTLIEIDPQAAQGQLAQARGGLAQAQAALTLAQRNFERYRALRAADAASELELDTARMQLDQAQGAVDQAEGAVSAASSMASDASVKAPFDGRVVRRLVEVGDLAAPGRPLLMLESEGGRRLALQVPESVAARAVLEVGRRVRVAIDSRPDLGRFEAAVLEVAPGVDPMSHTLSAKVDLPIEGLPSGASGRAWLETGRREAVVVPREAILEHGGLSLVVLKTAEGLAVTRVVTLGPTVSDADTEPAGAERVEILSGLSGGETVLLGLTSPPPAGLRVEIES